MRLLVSILPVVAITACAATIAKDARRPSAVACVDKPAVERAACFAAIPKLSDDEPATCAYFSPEHGWIAPQQGLFIPGRTPSAATDRRLKSYAWNDMPPVGDVQAASRACLVAMASELATAWMMERANVQAATPPPKEPAVDEQKQREEAEAKRASDARALVESTVADCKAKWSKDASACKSPPLVEAEAADCAKQCESVAQAAFDEGVASAKKACLDTWGEKGAKGECTIATPSGSSFETDAVAHQCTAQCKAEGPAAQKARAAAAKEAAERTRILDAYGQCMERGVGKMNLSFVESRKRCLVITRCETLEKKDPGACTSARDPHLTQ
jgi:hypothetical protein